MLLNLHHTPLSLRTIQPDDEALLHAIYASTREGEMAQLTHWTAEEKERFVRMQFEAQHQWYQQQYSGAHFWVVMRGEQPVGRLYLHPKYNEETMRIIDISILPRWRNQGFGTTLLKAVMAYAEAVGRGVSIHVESFNPAKQLYQQLGFHFVSATNGVYHLMEWKAPQTVSA